MKFFILKCYILATVLFSANFGFAMTADPIGMAPPIKQCAGLFTQPTKSERVGNLLFEDAEPIAKINSKYYFFVHKPGTDTNWALKYWRKIPRKISKLILKDESYVFTLLNPKILRPLEWFERITMDWPVRFFSEVLINKEKVFTKYVKTPVYVLLMATAAHGYYANQMKVQDAIKAIQDAPLHSLIAETPSMSKMNETLDIRFEIMAKNNPSVTAPVVTETLSQYYKTSENEQRTQPQVMFQHVENIISETPTANTAIKEAALGLTHVFYFKMQLVDEFYFYPQNYNQRKLKSDVMEDHKLLGFMHDIENTSFLNTLRGYVEKKLITEEELRYFTQKYFYNAYILELSHTLGAPLTILKGSLSYAETNEQEVTFGDLTIALRYEVAALLKSRR